MSEIATLAEPLTQEQAEANAQLLEQSLLKPKGRGSRVAPAQKALIYALADHAKLSQAAIARRLEMAEHTISAVLRTRDHQSELARNLLGSNSLQFVSDWLTASKQGAKKGRHEPARDALYALNVVAPPQQAQSSQSVTVILSGGDLPNELRVGIQQVSGLSPVKSE